MLVALPVALAAALAQHPLVVGLDNALVAGRGAAAIGATLPPEYVRVDVAAGIPTLEVLPRIAAARPRAIVIVDGNLAGFGLPGSRDAADDRRLERRAAERRSLVPLDVPLLTWPLGASRGALVRLPAAREPDRPWHPCVKPPAGVRVTGARPAGALPNAHAATMAAPAPLRTEPWLDDPHGIRFLGPSPIAPGVGAVAARVLDGRAVADRGGPVAWRPVSPAFGAAAAIIRRNDLLPA